MRKKIRAIQYGVGPIGASLVRLMREKQAIEVIGAIDTDPAKAGRDLGEVVGASDAPWGIEISADTEILGEAADVVVHSTSSNLPAVMDQLSACLASESCVVSTCEELAYPYRKYPDLAAKLDAEAKSWGVALVGTGVNPGFVMDKLVLTLGAAAQRVDSVSVTRIVDAAKRRLPLQKKVGAGLSPEEFRDQVAAGTIKHHGLPESIAMVADGFGFEIDEITETVEPVIARARLFEQNSWRSRRAELRECTRLPAECLEARKRFTWSCRCTSARRSQRIKSNCAASRCGRGNRRDRSRPWEARSPSRRSRCPAWLAAG